MKEDTNGVILLKNISFEYSNINPEEGIKYGKQGLELSKRINWQKGLGISYNLLGTYYFYKSDYPKSLEYFFKSNKIAQSINDSVTLANSFSNIGNIKAKYNKSEEAKKYYVEAVEINKKLKTEKSFENLGHIYGNLGGIYFMEKKIDSTFYYVNLSLENYKTINYLPGIASTYNNRAFFNLNINKFDDAKIDLDKALEINKNINNKSGIALGYGNLCELYLFKAKNELQNESTNQILFNKNELLNKSIENGLIAINLLQELGDLYFVSYSYNMLQESYELKGDYKNTLKYYKKYSEIQDSIFSSENNTKIANLEAKRENELKEKEIVILKKEKENQKLQRYAMFGGIAGLGIIIGLILIQRRKSEKLLLNVLPAKIAKRLKAKEHPIADHFDGASIMFIDIVGFTSLSSDADPKRIVSVLNDIFTIFDKLADKYGLEKIKTIGDAYMAVAGIPEMQSDHAKRAAEMALSIKQEMKEFRTSDGTEINFRIGIDCGPVVAGVIGEKKFIYDLWSDAVNTASRMESTGEKGQIQITENFKEELEKFDGNWNFNLRGEFEIKGKGLMKTYYLGN